MRRAHRFKDQTVKGQGYRRAGHTLSAELGGRIACFIYICGEVSPVKWEVYSPSGVADNIISIHDK